MWFRAELVLPLEGVPIRDGGVWVQDGVVRWVGPWDDRPAAEPSGLLNLGKSLVFPALINSHCHLDYTEMAGLIPPTRNFPQWLRSIVQIKGSWSYTEYATSWLAGARMLLETGVGTVVDIEAVPELFPDVSAATPLRLFSLLELIQLADRPDMESWLEARLNSWEELTRHAFGRGISPHSVYSTTGQLLRCAGKEAEARGWQVSVHLAESREEMEMVTSGSGPLWAWLGSQRSDASWALGSPVETMERYGLVGNRLLGVHLNHLMPGDAGLLSKRGAHVVHCPRSHEYFGHAGFPFAELREAGVQVCLGTDSLASIGREGKLLPSLDLFSEMRCFQRKHPQVTSKEIVSMVSRNPARALGAEGRLGVLQPGALADIAAIPLQDGSELLDPYDSLLNHRGPVSMVMIDGRVVHSHDCGRNSNF